MKFSIKVSRDALRSPFRRNTTRLFTDGALKIAAIRMTAYMQGSSISINHFFTRKNIHGKSNVVRYNDLRQSSSKRIEYKLADVQRNTNCIRNFMYYNIRKNARCTWWVTHRLEE